MNQHLSEMPLESGTVRPEPRRVSTLILRDEEIDPVLATHMMLNASSDGGAITQIDEVPDDFLDTLQKFDNSNTHVTEKDD
mmetsp:Transcript_13342/g.18224  ORF Transcript_13342/g.18224 Transcript_13342/m.18224 type:complete len:81 (+) Transcript_13342:574-816(+)